MLVFLVLLIGAIVGLTWGIVAAHKDTKSQVCGRMAVIVVRKWFGFAQHVVASFCADCELAAPRAAAVFQE